MEWWNQMVESHHLEISTVSILDCFLQLFILWAYVYTSVHMLWVCVPVKCYKIDSVEHMYIYILSF